MAPSSQSEDLLDLEQVTLQEAPLPPPIQRVMDPGQYRMLNILLHVVICALFILLSSILGFSDAESAMMTPDVVDLIDRLDLSMSSIDMTNTALAVHEEKECEMSGVGKLGEKSLFTLE